MSTVTRKAKVGGTVGIGDWREEFRGYSLVT